MKLILFDFECPKHGLFEELVKSDVKQIPCPRCKRTSIRQISAVRIDKTSMALQDGASPTSVDYFERVHRERRVIEDRHFRDNGDYGPAAGSDGGAGFHVIQESDFDPTT
jgi:hypothetical protein